LEHEKNMVLLKSHEGVAGGQYAEKETTHKILRAILWWPTLHKDVKKFYQVVMSVRDLGNLLREMKFPWFQK
jgi:hypothetical protein